MALLFMPSTYKVKIRSATGATTGSGSSLWMRRPVTPGTLLTRHRRVLRWKWSNVPTGSYQS
jgi:hypothetical protein